MAHKPKAIEPSPNATDPEQSRRFIDMAREVGVDETPGATDRALNKANLRQSSQTPLGGQSPTRGGQSEER